MQMIMKYLPLFANFQSTVLHRLHCVTLTSRALGIVWLGLVAGGLSLHASPLAPSAKQVAASSISVRENATQYTIDLTLPEQQPLGIDVRMEGKTLHISSGQAQGGVAQEQSFSLPAAQEGTAPSIRQDGGHVVITVAKGDSGYAGSNQAPKVQYAQPGKIASPPDSSSSIRDQILSQFAQMSRQMDQMMNSDFGSGQDPFDLLSSMGLSAGSPPSMGLFQMKEEKDKYILSAKLPEDQAKNIKVAVDNDRTLKISSEETNSSATGGFGTYSSSNFSQSLILPGPVKTDQVSMNYKDGRFEITLPKA